jgi:hypothetical protein
VIRRAGVESVQSRKGSLAHDGSRIAKVCFDRGLVTAVAGDHHNAMALDDVGIRRWGRRRWYGHYPARISSRNRPDAMMSSVNPAMAIPMPITIRIRIKSDRTRIYHGVRAS